MTHAEELRPAPAWARNGGHTRLQPPAPPGGDGTAVDRLLIAERIARYGWSFDERDREGLGECFTEAGVWEAQIMGTEPVGPFAGREAITAFLTGFWEEQTDQRRHVFTNVVVDRLEADAAGAHAYLVLLASSDGALRTDTAGPYRFELAREGDGVWRLTRLVAGFDVPY